MEMLPIYSVPLEELTLDDYGRLRIERPAFVEVVEKVWQFQAVMKLTSNGICTGYNGECGNNQCGGSDNGICRNSMCVEK